MNAAKLPSDGRIIGKKRDEFFGEKKFSGRAPGSGFAWYRFGQGVAAARDPGFLKERLGYKD